MCGRFEALTREEVEEVIKSVEQGLSAEAANEKPSAQANNAPAPKALMATPGSEVHLIVPGGAWAQSQGKCCGSGCSKCPWTRNPLALKPITLTWGFNVEWQKGRIFNTRIEHAGSTDSMWSESLERRRCIVPARAFFEPHRSETIASPRSGKQIKRQYVFRNAENLSSAAAPWLLMAGIFSNDCFSIVTTQPNREMDPIHDRMPLVLQPDEVRTWLSPHYAELADRSNLHLVAKPELENVPSVTQLSLF